MNKKHEKKTQHKEKMKKKKKHKKNENKKQKKHKKKKKIRGRRSTSSSKKKRNNESVQSRNGHRGRLGQSRLGQRSTNPWQLLLTLAKVEPTEVDLAKVALGQSRKSQSRP